MDATQHTKKHHFGCVRWNTSQNISSAPGKIGMCEARRVFPGQGELAAEHSWPMAEDSAWYWWYERLRQ